MTSVRLERYPGNPILVPQAAHSWEAGSVLNPAAVDVDGVIHLLYRATPTTRFGISGAYTSSIGVATSRDGRRFDTRPEPLIRATESYEVGLGCEDPRIARVGNEYLIFYNAVRRLPDGRVQVGVALASTTDFAHATKHGLILCAAAPSIRIKAAAPFPFPDGRVGLAFTVATESPLGSIMYLEYPDAASLTRPVPLDTLGRLLTHYDDHVLLAPTAPTERGPELGAAPIETTAGWLMLIAPDNHTTKRSWQIGALLLDRDDPRRVIGYRPDLLLPEADGERTGVVNNVVFPSGAVIRGKELLVYYGAGDATCGLATTDLPTLLEALMASPPPPRAWPY